jgi:hypothetical protein
MTSYFVVLSNAVEGRDEEFNDWYTNRHLGDVLQVPGFSSARRFGLAGSDKQTLAIPGVDAGESDPESKGAEYKYLALYGLDGEPAAAIAAMGKALGDGMFISESMHPKFSAFPYTALTDEVTAASLAVSAK